MNREEFFYLLPYLFSLALSLGVFFPVAGREQPVQPGEAELELVLDWFVKRFRRKA